MSTNDIPKAFLERFCHNFLNPGEDDVIPGPEAISYYMRTLSEADCEIDTNCYKYPEEFLRQLKYLQSLPVITPYMKVAGENHWEGIAVIGHGSFGSVYLCAWHPFGKMVRFSCFLSRCSIVASNDNQRSVKAPILFAIKDTQNDSFWADYCSEGHLTRRLNAAGCPNVVKVHDWLNLGMRPAMTLESDNEGDLGQLEYYFRILYDYYPGGSVDTLFDGYFENGVLIPEAFLWHLFHCMATAVLYCANGHAEPHMKPGWEEIVHKDIKPSNIFIGSLPPDDADEVYPNLFLADFGLAYALPNDDVREYKKSFCMEGTGEYIPPEARDIYAPWEISSKIDIYALSHTIQKASKRVYTVYTGDEHSLICTRPDADKYLPYSVALHNLCEECHSSDPTDRPDIYKLWQTTGRMATEWKQRVLEKRREASSGGKRFYEGMFLLDEKMREEVFANEALKRDFLAAASWEHRNRDVIEEMKEWAKREGGFGAG
ncbi:serine/threonine protein kinase [Emydomyces testavorans]|uniref:non-specific serine/threonine protein kinase n=1 Tax=Emydomyces testavorans TaxID=2070801 RepID=A0AAF0DKH0_9EURO|nr:serine/threonine protein kinase [Emydomyces testavorans]